MMYTITVNHPSGPRRYRLYSRLMFESISRDLKRSGVYDWIGIAQNSVLFF